MATKKKVQFKEGDRVTYIGKKFSEHAGYQATITPFPEMYSTQRDKAGKLIPRTALTGRGALYVVFDDGGVMIAGADRLKLNPTKAQTKAAKALKKVGLSVVPSSIEFAQ
ncbi:MAG TPA: hypothetical protein VOA88_01140 [Candidatus Dormibacteraeota bacterium]|nr:hypothetical protein [Candidatus Dormibacteraeota bacterium]